jgi:hypothetical protein
MFEDFLVATAEVENLDRSKIRKHALAHYSTEVAAAKYERYFHNLLKLWDSGWYEVSSEVKNRLQME